MIGYKDPCTDDWKAVWLEVPSGGTEEVVLATLVPVAGDCTSSGGVDLEDIIRAGLGLLAGLIG